MNSVVRAYSPRNPPGCFFYVLSLLHRGVIFACLPHLYLFEQGDFKATASRRPTHIFKMWFRWTLKMSIAQCPPLEK